MNVVCDMCGQIIDNNYMDDELMWLDDPRDFEFICEEDQKFIAKCQFIILQKMIERGL